MFLQKLRSKIRGEALPQEPEKLEEIKEQELFSTHAIPRLPRLDLETLSKQVFQRTAADFKAVEVGTAMDDSNGGESPVNAFSIGCSPISEMQLSWFASQGFIGYQACGIIAQHWLVDKACSMPAEDAVRTGFEMTVGDNQKIDTEVKDAIRQYDSDYRLKDHLVEFVRMGRIFGIRILMFKIKPIDREYYAKPFNLDGITPNSYEGIVQIDPYWITPELDVLSSADPVSLHYFEPTWWKINGQRIHRSHLMIFKTGSVIDVLKPTYLYGGISIPQRIYERVYAAERTANEAPMLALSKRTIVLKTDLANAIANQEAVTNRMNWAARWQNNFGKELVDATDEVQQLETSLTDLDSVIMTQYQLVAAIAEVPATKLLGTSPKGFNATGEFEEASYHEFLQSIQSCHLTKVIKRHHEILIRSNIVPEFKIPVFKTDVSWEPLDAMTSKEQAEVNRLNAETGTFLVNSGALAPAEERERIITDPKSGYNGISVEGVMEDPEEGRLLEEPDLYENLEKSSTPRISEQNAEI
jgi:phage-related protein (TIGR01555 family)